MANGEPTTWAAATRGNESNVAETSDNSSGNRRSSGLALADTQSMAMSHRKKSYNDDERSSSHRRMDHNVAHPPSPPLLLEPPPENFAVVKRTLAVGFLRTCAALGIQARTILFAWRVSLFLAKLASLIRPCWPYLPKLEISVPLILVATLDLAKTSWKPSRSGEAWNASGQGVSLLLLVFHFGILLLARRWNSMCLGFDHDWVDWS